MRKLIWKYFVGLCLFSVAWFLFSQFIVDSDTTVPRLSHGHVQEVLLNIETNLLFTVTSASPDPCLCSGESVKSECHDECELYRKQQKVSSRAFPSFVKFFSLKEKNLTKLGNAREVSKTSSFTLKVKSLTATRTPTTRAGTARANYNTRNVRKHRRARGSRTTRKFTLKPLTETRKPKPRLLRCDGCFKPDFRLLVDQGRLCERKDNQVIDVIFLILTTHEARENRQAIRETWASVSRNNTSMFRHVFLLGAVANSTLMRESEAESRQFGDMVMADFVDAYFNLTLKVVVGLKWAVSRCPHARYFVKTDDDMWLNPPALARVLSENDDHLQRGIIGHCLFNQSVDRVKTIKFYVPRFEYPYDNFPNFCKGMAYGGSLKVARDIVAVSRNIPFFFIEDVYIGFCLQELGYTVRHEPGFRRLYDRDDDCVAKNSTTYVMMHVTLERMYEYWEAEC